MGFLALVVQAMTAIFAAYLGFTSQFNIVFLLVCPMGFVFGHLMKRSTGASVQHHEHGLGAIRALVSSYLIGLLLVAIFFGVGYGIMHVLQFKPAEGVGRY